MRRVLLCLGVLAAAGYAAVFAGAFSLASGAYQARVQGEQIAELRIALIQAEVAYRLHMQADSARDTAIHDAMPQIRRTLAGR